MPIDYSKWDRLAASLDECSEDGSGSTPKSQQLESGFALGPVAPFPHHKTEMEKRQLRLYVSRHPCPDRDKVTEWAQDARHAGALDTTQEPLHAVLHGCRFDIRHFDYEAFRAMWEAVGQDVEKETQRAVGERLSAKGGLCCMQLNYYVFKFALRGQYFYRAPKPLAVWSHPRALEFWWDGIGEWRS